MWSLMRSQLTHPQATPVPFHSILAARLRIASAIRSTKNSPCTTYIQARSFSSISLQLLHPTTYCSSARFTSSSLATVTSSVSSSPAFLNPSSRSFHSSSSRLHQSTALPNGVDVHVTFITPEGERHAVTGKEGENLLALAHQNNVELEGACEASLACSTCHVILPEEYYRKLEQPVDEENDMLDLAFGLTDTSVSHTSSIPHSPLRFLIADCLTDRFRVPTDR